MEYKVVAKKEINHIPGSNKNQNLEELLNFLGDEGWELCHFGIDTMIFKRNKQMK